MIVPKQMKPLSIKSSITSTLYNKIQSKKIKKTLALFTTVLCLIFIVQAQKVQKKDIIGTWILVIDIEEKMEEEAEDADTINYPYLQHHIYSVSIKIDPAS